MMMQLSKAKSSCSQKNIGMLALVQAKAANYGADCEGMCKRLGSYPDCQCPGFNGEPATDGDTRACYEQNCQDPTTPCPTDAFVNCVSANTKSFVQWQAVMRQVDQKFTMMMQLAKAKSSCSEKNIGMLALMQAKAATYG